MKYLSSLTELVITIFAGAAILMGTVVPRAHAIDEAGDKTKLPASSSTASVSVEYDPNVGQLISLFDRVWECHVLAGTVAADSKGSGSCERRGPCERTTVRCLSPEALREELQRQGLQSCDAICSISNCTVFLSEAWCQRLGLQDGQDISVPDLRRIVEEHPPRKAREAIENCAVQHERKHLEQDARNTPVCMLEQEAYWEQTQCLEEYRELFCGGGRDCSADCLLLKVAGCESETLRALNGCSCQIDPGWCSRCSGSHCDSCEEICQDNLTSCYNPPLEACGATLTGMDPQASCKGHTNSYCRRRVSTR